ncbi:hypothetical protein GPECTOR_39g378 [Gonium pectorale]|uniref:Uncharacterized protein n=1 Tax=Gonium pectorale TaxID=33097 RepID=A0A150GAM3_GONPE|nr:hypothetical protein GPECTOR_39g378 [Gonium pectorale]|eukprot:KXZ46884.1 hypothetical protein GPECTOR_39g378 [Gonium pectorale]
MAAAPAPAPQAQPIPGAPAWAQQLAQQITQQITQLRDDLVPFRAMAARAHNRTVPHGDRFEVVPCTAQGPNYGLLPPNPPVTAAQLTAMRRAQLDPLLQFYVLPVNGTVREKCMRLARHLGINFEA